MTRHPYPKRRAFFAMRYVRLLGKICLANQLGPDACWLLTVIVTLEDAKSYRDAVTFWNEQLAPLVGCPNVWSLIRLRKRVVDAGWLHYEAGGKGQPGRYWAVVPPRFEGMDDLPADENPAEYADGSLTPVPTNPQQNRKTTATEPQDNRNRDATEPQEKRQTSLPVPVPGPGPKEPPLPPEGGAAAEPPAGEAAPKPKKTRTKTARDHLFDALVEVTASDREVSGGYVNKLVGKLVKADPPYTPDEVRRFGDPAFLAAALPWLAGVPTIGIIEKHIGLVRRPVTPGAAHGRAAGPARPGRVEARPGQFDHLDAGTVPPEFFAPPDPPGGPGD